MNKILAGALVLALAPLMLATGDRNPPYVYGNGGEFISGNFGPDDGARAVKELAGSGGFLWFRIHGREYIVRNTTTLADVERLFEPLRALDPAFDDLRGRLDAIESRENEIEEHVDRIEDQIDRIADDDDHELTAAERVEVRQHEARSRELERDLREVVKRIRELEVEEQELDERYDELEREAEEELVPLMEKAVQTGTAVQYK